MQGFGSIGYGGTVMHCVALCNEHGETDHIPINQAATIAWERALRREGHQLLDQSGTPTDWLVGPVLILFGDREFMKERS